MRTALSLSIAALIACSSPPGRPTGQGDEGGEAPRSVGAAPALLTRLPWDAFLVLRLDHRAIFLSPFRDNLFGDEGLIVEVAISTHFPAGSQIELPQGFVDRASETVFAVTMDDVGISDAITLVSGDFPSGTADALLAHVGEQRHVTARGEARVVDPGVGDAVAVELPGSALAFGPRDRVDDLLRAVSGGPPSRVNPTTVELAAKTALDRSAIALVISVTDPVRGYLREALAAENVAGGAIETLRGLGARITLSDGIALDGVGLSTSEDDAAATSQFFQESIDSFGQSPAVQAIGLADVLTRARIGAEGREATIRATATVPESHAIFDRMRAMIVAYLQAVDDGASPGESPGEP